MALSQQNIDTFARDLDRHLLEGRERERLTLQEPELSLQDAYLIQDSGVRLRLGRGERVVGYKMGLTSEAKRQQMGLHSPIYGVLTDGMRLDDREPLVLRGLIHPKIEPEVAFWVDRELQGPVTEEQAWSACSAVGPALEILDSRYRDFKYFSLPDVVADNASSSLFFARPARDLRAPRAPGPECVADAEMLFRINGHTPPPVRTSAISGHPLRSLVALCALLRERGLALPAGSVVLAGSAAAAVPLKPGMSFSLEVQGIGALDVSIRSDRS